MTDSHSKTILKWCLGLCQKSQHKPLVVGINGPQGVGKTTLSQHLVEQLAQSGLQALSFSIDDFYLTRPDQIKLAEKFFQNPYLQQRGYPGTHDIQLGVETLDKIVNNKALKIPTYDKSKYAGKGDRNPPELWKEVKSPVHIIFFDGWMLGFKPVERSKLPNPHFELVNEILKSYERWYSFINAFIYLDPLEINYTIDWRIDAEEKMKASGKPGMTQQEARDYIELFIPAYETYLSELRHAPPSPVLRIQIRKDRSWQRVII